MSDSMVEANKRANEGSSLTLQDLLSLEEENDPRLTREVFAKNFEETGSGVWALLRVYGSNFWKSIIIFVFSNALQFYGPISLKLLLAFYSDDSYENYYGYLIAISILVVYCLRILLFNHSYDYIYYCITLNYSSIYSQVYAKVLEISEALKGEIGSGRILNLISSDTTFIAESILTFHQLWLGPFNLIGCVILWYIELSWAAFLGMATILVLVGLQGFTNSIFVRNRILHQKEADSRTRLLQEFFDGIRIIKYYAWEKFAMKKVEIIRDAELDQMKFGLCIRTLIEFMINTIPMFALIVMFTSYTAWIGDLNVSKAFTTISAMYLVRPQIAMYTISMINMAQAYASLKRLVNFFNIIQSSEKYLQHPEDMMPGSVSVENGSFIWITMESKKIAQEFNELVRTKFGNPQNSNVNAQRHIDPELQENITLKDINLSVSPGEFVVVIGEVGSGKTSLLHSLIGEMTLLKGKVSSKGKIAFVPQSPWIINATIRDNIIMNMPYEEKKYRRIFKLCELSEDFNLSKEGDLIEIGSRGINLSGGQKQRISIARALYSDSDIYIIDDCLSALDAGVAKSIFYNAILGELQRKTRILATHALHFLKHQEKIVVLKQGRITDIGNYSTLLSSSSTFQELAALKKNERKKEKEQKMHKQSQHLIESSEEGSNNSDSQIHQQEKQKLTVKEVQEVGRVKLSNYWTLMKFSGFFITFIVIFFFIVSQVFMIFGDWWPGVWGGDEYNESISFYITVYLIIGLIFTLSIFFRAFAYMYMILALARNTQMNLIWSILQAPLSWFNSTPIGRIINRTCKDQAILDNDIVWVLQGTMRFSLRIIGAIITIGSVTPYFFILLALIMLGYCYCYMFAIQASRDCRRIESISKSPIFSQYGETLDGLNSIRSCGYSEMLDTKILKLISTSNDAFFMMGRCARFLNLRIGILGSFATFGAFIFAVLARDYNWGSKSLIGLSVSQSLSLLSSIALWLMMIIQLDTKMNAVERITEYIDNTPKEKDFESPLPEDSDWPREGQIEITNLHLRYQTNPIDVIDGLSMSIKPKEKIGIAGRTGSGKSTITLGMLRILEPYHNPNIYIDDKITIDSQNIENIGLHILRNKIAIIPQDPVLFSGTLLSNLNPFKERSAENDLEILEALEQTKLLNSIYNKIYNKEGLLASISVSAKNLNVEERNSVIEFEVQEKGSNFSMGERQLLCTARAILRKPKILIMDEATASIDEATDKEIQRMIKENFRDSTVLTIAHRIHTIIDYDRIAILRKGKINEFDTPYNLLCNPDSKLTRVVQKQGESFYHEMLQIAQSHAPSA